MSVPEESTVYRRHFYIVQRREDCEPAGYFEFFTHPDALYLRELAARPGCSLRDVTLRAAHFLYKQIQERRPGDKPFPQIVFNLGRVHPAYETLPRLLAPGREPYAWYIRVPDLPAFLQHIRPVLEQRLARSVIAGYSGTLRLNFFTDQIALVFDQGRLAEVGSYTPERLEAGDATFPGQTFLQLLFGYRSLAELSRAFADAGARTEEADVLLNALFPRQTSAVLGLG
jgi:hypothetical protein